MTIPAFATVAFTVPVGKQPSAQVVATMSQPLGNDGMDMGLGPLAEMGWSASINDLTSLSADGLTVRRLIAFVTPKAPPGGQLPYRNVAAVQSCLRNLYKRQLEAYCGTTVTGLEPIVWDDPATILGTSLGSWWTSVQLGNALAGFANPWTSTGVGGLPGAPTNVAANPFALGAADPVVGNGRPATSSGAPDFMQTGAIAAVNPPFSIAVIGIPPTAAAAGNWTAGLAAPNGWDLIRDGVNETFTTDGGGNTIAGPPQDADPHLFGADSDDANGASRMLVDNVAFPGSCGVGVPTGLTMLADATGAAGNLAAGLLDVVTSATLAKFTAAQWTALWGYAQGRYGLGYW